MRRCTASISGVGMSEPTLVVEQLNAYYGAAQALEGVSFTMTENCLGIIGRNGMGKTTLCQSIVGLTPPRPTGSVRFDGNELVGRSPQSIARLGIAYVPQGRRLFPSLTVEEHLKIASRRHPVGREWTIPQVYDLFPRLAERRKNGGNQLSGGEQQMLAIGRALMTGPRFIVMDEPSEGLAPSIIHTMIDTFKLLASEGLHILLVEQNLHVATTMAARLLVMVAGQVAAETTSADLIGNADAQRRFLGVEPTEVS